MSDPGTRIVLVVELVAGHLVARVAPSSAAFPDRELGALSAEPRVPRSDRSFAGRVRQLRRRLGISPYELARRLGVSPDTLTSWELGLHAPQKLNRDAVMRLERRWRSWFTDLCRREGPP